MIDKLPDKVHITVPKGFRKRNIPKEYIMLHKENLPLSELEDHGAFMVTNLFKTLKDTKESLEQKGIWRNVADRVYKSGRLTEKQILKLGIINSAQYLKTITTYNVKNGSNIKTSIGDEVYYRTQNAKKIFDSMENQGRWKMSASTSNVRKSQQGGFTIVELLVVIAVISVLAGMLLPVLENATEAAKTIACANNQKQCMTSTNMYVNDHNGWFLRYFWRSGSTDATWGTSQWENGYGDDKSVYLCPSYPPEDSANYSKYRTFGHFGNQPSEVERRKSTGTSIDHFELPYNASHPSNTLWFADSVGVTPAKTATYGYQGWSVYYASTSGSLIHLRHMDNANISFIDSHVKTCNGDEIYQSFSDEYSSSLTFYATYEPDLIVPIGP
jgi:prepilin-type N-terminal cleavage/methylation domain-containing protein/prepilin-type processing-associated H-X9-DG protein